VRLVPLVLLSLIAAGCSRSASGGGAPTVATTVYPVEFVARQVVGDAGEVVNVTPPGAEPHDVELTSDQVIDVIESDLVVYLGGDFQPAVEEALGDAGGHTLDALAVVGPLLEPEAGEEPDAHFWLDPARLARVAEAIAGELGEAVPDEAERFRDAAGRIQDRLLALDREYADTLQDCASDQIVTTHEAFGYLAERYGLEQVGISGIDPESEPSPERIAEVTEFVRSNDVRTIFFERLLAPDAAETIARETDADTSVLDPIESEPEKGDYIQAMHDNLQALSDALGCR
jgi:zinc transport system substrate-binding protein